MTAAERTASLGRVLEAIAAAHAGDSAPDEGLPRFLSLWHCNAPFASLSRTHMRRFLAAHFLFSELDALSAPQHAELEAMLRSLEAQMGAPFPEQEDGDSASAEELLTTSWLLIHDPAVSPAVKADLIKSTVKWAGLEPKDAGPQDNGTGGVKITINLGSDPRDARTIEATTVDVQDATAIEN